MKKRILSLVLAVLMLLSVLPVTALAADSGAETPTTTEPTLVVPAESDDEAVHVIKSVETDEEGTKLTLEAYATNSISRQTSYEPLDIVLVLDVSGSMKEYITSYEDKYVATKSKNWTYKNVKNSNYYYQDSDGVFYKVEAKSRNVWNNFKRTTYYRLVANGKTIGKEVTRDNATAYTDVLYTYERVQTGSKQKIKALQDAVNAFIANVANQKNSDGIAIANRISIVKFAGNKINWNGSNEGNGKYWIGKDHRNNSQVVKGLTDASTNAGELKTAVDALSYGGETRADYGMELAKSVLDGRTDKTRKSVVIMFTDGVPTEESSWSDSVAKEAIKYAKELKAGGTLVYTIGMFTNANPADTTKEDTNKYMHAVSSNYPDASYDYGWFIIYWQDWQLGNRAEDSNYYRTASTAGDLDDVFQAISQEISSLNVKVDGTSVLSDTLSEMFDFAPVGDQTVAGSITVKQVPVTGENANGYTWGTPEDATGVTASVDTENPKKLNVTGFDYGANAVTTKTEGDTVTYSGCKLVVTIPIKPDTTYAGWEAGTHYYDTNADGAGLTYGEKDNRQTLALTDSPEAPVTAYTVSYRQEGTDKPTSAVDYTTDTTAYIEGQTVTVKQTPSEEGYTFDGWYLDGTKYTGGSTYTMEDSNVEFTGTWTKNPPQTTSVSFMKVWMDTPNTEPYVDIPSKVTVQLIDATDAENPEVKQTKEIVAPYGTTHTFDNLPIKNAAGEVIQYTVKEIQVGDKGPITAGGDVFEATTGDKVTGTWTSTVNTSTDQAGNKSLTITNTYTATTATVTITKEFVPPQGGKDFEVPTSLRLKLVDTTDETNSIYLLPEEGTSRYTAVGVPAGTYKVEEENATVDGYNCKPTLTATGETPELNADGTITVAAGGTYSYSLTNTYTAKEEPKPAIEVKKSAMVKHYKLQDNGSYWLSAPEALGEDETVMVGDVIVYTITVTNNTGAEIPVESVTITDTFNGKGVGDMRELRVSSDSETLADIDTSNAVVNADGTKTYTIALKEDSIPTTGLEIELVYPVQYADTELEPAVLTNTAKVTYNNNDYPSNEVEIPVNTEYFNLVVQKQWYGVSYPTVKVQLLENGVEQDDKIIEIAESDTSTVATGMIERLPLREDGKQIIYTVKEINIADATYIGTEEKEINKKTVTCDVFETSDKSGKWYADYADQDATDGRVAIINRYEKVEPNAELRVTKKILKDNELHDTVKAEIGEDITYVVTIENTGNVTLSGLKLKEYFVKGNNSLDGVYDSTAATATKYELENDEVTIPVTLEPDDSVTYYLYYEVHKDDKQVENSVTVQPTSVEGFRPASSDTVYVNVNRGEVDGYNVTGLVYKIVRSEKGTYNPDEEVKEFYFTISSDEDGTDVLGNVTVPFTHTVEAGEDNWAAADLDFDISLNQYNALETKTFGDNEYKVVYLIEREGNDSKMTYMTSPITLYLYDRAQTPMIALLGQVPELNTDGRTLIAYSNPDEHDFADVTNIYNKKYEKPVKVGPQLNRDDHVAYIMGYPDGTVQPEGEITRAEACTIFFRLLTDSSRDYYFAKTNDYSDVNAGDWFNNAISTLSNAGIVTGYNDGTFRPNQPITRGEMAKIIANFANLKHGDKTFTDLAGHWSKSYVELAAGNGWIAGYPDGSFRPDQKITRAETVTMINRVLERVPAKESRLLSRSIMLTFPDNNPGDWYYIAIQEASNSHEYQRSVYETTGDEMWTKLIDNVDWTKLEK